MTLQNHLPNRRSLRSFVTLCVLPLLIATSYAETLTFRNGLNQYGSATDTTLHGTNEQRSFSSYGGDEVLGVAGVRSEGYRQLGLIRFDRLIGEEAGEIPRNTRIRKATLRLYKIDEPADNGQYERIRQQYRERAPQYMELRAHKMLTQWAAGGEKQSREEGAATFAYRAYHADIPVFWGDKNQIEEGPVAKVDFDSRQPALSDLVPHSGPIWMEWDVTAIVQSWVDRPEENQGFFLRAASSYVGAFFASCEYREPEKRPELIVEY